ncbi:MAG: TlpA family protein disulfide reductase [Armatimonadota bacterium]
MRFLKLGLYSVAAASAALAFSLAGPGSAKAVKGELPPDFSGTTLDGKKITLSDFRGKNPVVLNFYAEFCGPCRKEFPHLKQLDEKLGAKGLKVIAVSLDEDRAAAASIPQEAKAKFPVVFDPKGAIAEKYGVQAIPHTVVIDRSGKVHQVLVGLNLDALDSAVEQVVR